MTWTRPADIRALVQKWWDRGDILASLASGEPMFPKRVPLKTPSSTELSSRFDEVRRWIADLTVLPYSRVEMREFKHRLLGTNSIPDEVWIDSIDQALALIGKRGEASRFAELLETTRIRCPELSEWMEKRPLRALELADDWPRLLTIVLWLKSHPRPGFYLRQVDLPGIHSKFIEAHRGVLAEILDLALPPEAVDPNGSGIGGFAQRYGFRDKPARIRFRILDPHFELWPGGRHADVTVDGDSFIRLVLPLNRVFVTENEINFLSLPPLTNSLAVFGAGYGFDILSQAAWLHRCRLHYWGDIDTHGFAILDQLRRHFPHTESLLMDRETLMIFERFWGEEDKQTLRDLARLNAAEQALYDDLRDNRIRKNLRLEQERIGFGWVTGKLRALPNPARNRRVT